VQDSVWGHKQHSYYNNVAGHPLEGLGDIIWAYPHRNVVRAILDKPWGNTDIIPENPQVGTIYSHDFSYQFPEGHKPENSFILVMISDHNENSIQDRLVLDANKTKLKDLELSFTSSNTDHQLLNEVKISPNPSSDFINIELPIQSNFIKVISSEGALIFERKMNSKIATIELEQLEEEGLYFLVFEMNGQTYSRPFMKLN